EVHRQDVDGEEGPGEEVHRQEVDGEEGPGEEDRLQEHGPKGAAMTARDSAGSILKEIGSNLPVDRLRDEAKHALSAAGERAASSAGDKVKEATTSLNDVTDSGGVLGKAGAEGA